MQKRELFEKQMQQLKMQQLQVEQAILAAGSNGSSSGDSTSRTLADLRSTSMSRRNSNDAADLWSQMEKMSIGDLTRTSINEYVARHFHRFFETRRYGSL
jgi:hypothetical protein